MGIEGTVGWMGGEMPVAGDPIAEVPVVPGFVLAAVEPASCQAGIDGGTARGRGLGDDGVPIGRLSNKAFNDFTSCCKSLRD
jgi:hypothetical protein